jgi:hypothetical protein
MSEQKKQQWLTATEAAEILKMTSRQVHRYGESGKITTRRAGRRVLFLGEEVAALADELQVEHKPAHIIRTEVGTQFLEYFKQRDATTHELLQRQTEVHEQTGQTLNRLEESLEANRKLSSIVLGVLIILILIVLILIVIVLKR